MTNADMLNKCKIEPIEYTDNTLIDHLEIDDDNYIIPCQIDFDSVDVNEWVNKRHHNSAYGVFEVDCNKLVYYIEKLESEIDKGFFFLDFPELWPEGCSSESVYNFTSDLYLLINLFRVYKFLYFKRNNVVYVENFDNYFYERDKGLKDAAELLKCIYFEPIQIDEIDSKWIINEAAHHCDGKIYFNTRMDDGILAEYYVAKDLYHALLFQMLRIISFAQKGIFDSVGICANSACRSVFEMEHGNQRYCPKCRQGKNFDAMRKAESRKRKKVRDAQNATKE